MLPNIFCHGPPFKNQSEIIDTIENSRKWMLFWQCDVESYSSAKRRFLYNCAYYIKSMLDMYEGHHVVKNMSEGID